MGIERSPSEDSPLDDDVLGFSPSDLGTSLDGNNEIEAQIDPRCFAPRSNRRNSSVQGTKTSLLFVLLEYCFEESILRFEFSDQLSTIWRLDKFANASFHLHFQTSVLQWRKKIRDDELLRNRLIKQHLEELRRLTYPMPKNPGSRPKRKRGYNDQGSTRPHHQRFRSDKDTSVSVWAEDLHVVEKVVVFGRRPTVTYRRLPYSREIGRLLDLGLLRKEGSFITPVIPRGD